MAETVSGQLQREDRAMKWWILPWGIALVAGLFSQAARAQDQDVADIPSQEYEVKTPDAKKDSPATGYFLIGPKKGAKAPAKGYALLIVLPGGDGGRNFHPFIKRIYKNATGPDFVAAQPIAVKYEKSASFVWPTKKTPGLGAVPSTEEFVEAVVADAAARVSIDPARVYLMVWSSSGPAAYAISLQKSKSVTGFFISMSVFQPTMLPPLTEAKGEAYVIEHSPEDKTCPYRMAKDAEQRLTKAGAKVKFVTTTGDHGWSGDVYGRMREGLAWLDKNHAAPPKQAPKKPAKKK
jgi:predicted esterase